MKLEHDLICRPGRWSIQGKLCDDARTYPLQGDASIVRRRAEWRCTTRIDSEYRTALPPIVCLIQPCPQGSLWTSWRADTGDTGLGVLIGRFVQSGAMCLSLWESLDGAHTGSDWLSPVNGGRCTAHGTWLRGGIPLFTWELELTRAEEGA